MNRTTKAITTGVAAGAAALAATLGGPAQAASAAGPAGSLSVYSDSYYTGDSSYFYDAVNDLRYYNYTSGSGSPMNDSISSVINDTDRAFCFFQDANYGSFLFSVAPHSALFYVGDNHNDRVSSFLSTDTTEHCLPPG
jgi:hypothetical protein